MKVLLTSFGRDYRSLPEPEGDIFYSMPPIRFTSPKLEFRPDFLAFVLAESLIMDRDSFDRLVTRPHPFYSGVARFFNIAQREGLIELCDYQSVLSSKRPLLDAMLERDLIELEPWVAVINRSRNIWHRLTQSSCQLQQHEQPTVDSAFLHSHE